MYSEQISSEKRTLSSNPFQWQRSANHIRGVPVPPSPTTRTIMGVAAAVPSVGRGIAGPVGYLRHSNRMRVSGQTDGLGRDPQLSFHDVHDGTGEGQPIDILAPCDMLLSPCTRIIPLRTSATLKRRCSRTFGITGL